MVRGGSRAKIFYAHGPQITMGLLFTLCGVWHQKFSLAADAFAHLQANGSVLRTARRVGPSVCKVRRARCRSPGFWFRKGFELTHLLLPLQLPATAQAPSQISELRTESGEGCWDLTPKDQDSLALFRLREYSTHPSLLVKKEKKNWKKDRKKRLQNVFHFYSKRLLGYITA